MFIQNMQVRQFFFFLPAAEPQKSINGCKIVRNIFLQIFKTQNYCLWHVPSLRTQVRRIFLIILQILKALNYCLLDVPSLRTHNSILQFFQRHVPSLGTVLNDYFLTFFTIFERLKYYLCQL